MKNHKIDPRGIKRNIGFIAVFDSSNEVNFVFSTRCKREFTSLLKIFHKIEVVFDVFHKNFAVHKKNVNIVKINEHMGILKFDFLCVKLRNRPVPGVHGLNPIRVARNEPLFLS